MRALSRNMLIILFTLTLMSTAHSQQKIYNSKGKLLGKRTQRTMTPKIVVDTLRMSGGFGVLRLNSSFTKGFHAVNASNSVNMRVQVTQILSDTSEAVNYYGVRKFTDSVMIKSSQADDSGLVEIRIDTR